MNSRLNTSLIFIVTLLLMISMTSVAFAANPVTSSLSSEQVEWIKNNVTVENGNIVVPDASVKGRLSLSVPTVDYCTTTLNDGTPIYWVGTNDVSLGASITRVINNAQSAGKMQDLTHTLDINADTEGAGVMLAGLAPIINLFLGIIATFIMFGMAISSSLDICYIAFPVFRNKCEDMKATGNSIMTKKSANGDTSLRWVTDDAQYAVNSTVTEGNGKSPWTAYFKKRVAAYIFLTIIMFILLTGNITLITDIALKVISGIMNVLQSLA